ncbi:hypothetical protein EVAR_49307_1 [Eumeta japonica]|uniref:Uncharacterized protein n=1 Tax=Eumeta variegata TaxID=151549 RepID=A0A4C1YB06_EUMVA|nr:hypothetical protein EVAR_49307_1 [Eumeta japonica]
MDSIDIKDVEIHSMYTRAELRKKASHVNIQRIEVDTNNSLCVDRRPAADRQRASERAANEVCQQQQRRRVVQLRYIFKSYHKRRFHVKVIGTHSHTLDRHRKGRESAARGGAVEWRNAADSGGDSETHPSPQIDARACCIAIALGECGDDGFSYFYGYDIYFCK